MGKGVRAEGLEQWAWLCDSPVLDWGSGTESRSTGCPICNRIQVALDSSCRIS